MSEVARVASLHYYPVKSAGALDVDELEIGPRGPVRDREWMIVDDNRKFISQREKPQLARVRPRFSDTSLFLTVPEEDGGSWEWEVPLFIANQPELEVQVWDSRVRALDEGDPIADALSLFLGQRVRLVRMPPEGRRPVAEKLGYTDTHTAFADSMPTLLVSQMSVNDLNGRLQDIQQVRPDRFRMNILIEGSPAFAEDSWKKVRIGAVDFDVAKSCSRCVIVNTDQLTGARSPEVLKTLATYRRDGSKILFGRYLVHHAPGTLKVGDPVSVSE